MCTLVHTLHSSRCVYCIPLKGRVKQILRFDPKEELKAVVRCLQIIFPSAPSHPLTVICNQLHTPRQLPHSRLVILCRVHALKTRRISTVTKFRPNSLANTTRMTVYVACDTPTTSLKVGPNLIHHSGAEANTGASISNPWAESVLGQDGKICE